MSQNAHLTHVSINTVKHKATWTVDLELIQKNFLVEARSLSLSLTDQVEDRQTEKKSVVGGGAHTNST